MARLVWYVSYGSNMRESRFGCYLHGGRPPQAAQTYPGARDQTPPLAARAAWLDGQVYFATESKVWRGGRALYDPDALARTAARAYLITEGQFSDVVAQEMGRAPSGDVDVAEVLSSGRAKIGEGRYETLVLAGEDDGVPMLTFTAPWAMSDVPLLAPSGAYLRMLGSGLLEAHGWSSRAAADYLAGLPGARGTWSPDEIAALIDAPG